VKEEGTMSGSLTGRERYQTYKQDLGWTEERAKQNVGETEAWFSLVAGGALAIAGLRRRSWLGATLAAIGASLLFRGATGHCMLYQSLGINTNETNTLGRRKVRTTRAIKVQKSVNINRPAEELYRFWRKVENLPKIMSHLQSVEAVNDRLSHWTVKALPIGGASVEWDAEIVNEVENELIGWRSLQGAHVDNAGSVRFQRAGEGRGTTVTVTLQYDPPAGLLGAGIAKLLGEDPERMIEEDLQRFKQMMESNQSEGSQGGAGSQTAVGTPTPSPSTPQSVRT
jgi:uncharacterized membrane protein